MVELAFYLCAFLGMVILCVVVVGMVSKPAPKPKAKTYQVINFETIMILLGRDATFENLEEAAGLILNNYDELNLNKSQKKYFLYELARHPNAKANLILRTLDEFSSLNPDLAQELEKSVKRGLDRRGISM